MDLKTGEIKKYLHNEDNINRIGHSWVRSVYQENIKNTLAGTWQWWSIWRSGWKWWHRPDGFRNRGHLHILN